MDDDNVINVNFAGEDEIEEESALIQSAAELLDEYDAISYEWLTVQLRESSANENRRWDAR